MKPAIAMLAPATSSNKFGPSTRPGHASAVTNASMSVCRCTKVFVSCKKPAIAIRAIWNFNECLEQTCNCFAQYVGVITFTELNRIGRGGAVNHRHARDQFGLRSVD